MSMWYDAGRIEWFSDIAETSSRACALIKLARSGNRLETVYKNPMWDSCGEILRQAGVPDGRAFCAWALSLTEDAGIAEFHADNGLVLTGNMVCGDHIGIVLKSLHRKAIPAPLKPTADVHSQLQQMRFDESEVRFTHDEYELLFEQRRLLRALLGQYGIIVARYDPYTGRMDVSRSHAEVIGMDPVLENVPASSLEEGTVMPGSIADYIGFFDSIRRGEPRGRVLVRRRRGGCMPRWMEMQFTNVFDTEGKVILAIIRYIDRTEARERDLAYARRQDFEAMLNVHDVLALDCDLFADAVEVVMGQCSDMISPGGSYDAAVETCVGMCMCADDAERLRDFLRRENMVRDFGEGRFHSEIELQLKINDGRTIWVRCVKDMLTDPYNGALRAFLQLLDIDARKQAELELKELSERDPLTGALNRRAFINAFAEICERNEDARHAFLMIDMDEFSEVNNALGHVRGDQVLSDAVNALHDAVGGEGVIGRIGGDEFAVVLTDIRRISDVIATAEQICSALSFEINGVRVSASMGISIYPKHGDTFGELYEKADAALYRAKGFGRDRFLIYRQEEDGWRVAGK